MGCSSSRDDERAATSSKQPDLSALAALDADVMELLRNGAIKLLSADFLRSTHTMKTLVRRQELEALEAHSRERIFLSSAEAVAALQRRQREVGALTYCWCSAGNPDPAGAYLSALTGFLRSHSGAHIVGIFWDYASLPQAPRTDAEHASFREALQVMADLYASAFSVTVIRHLAVPPKPPSFEGAYNERPYDARGWPTFESAVSTEVLARVG